MEFPPLRTAGPVRAPDPGRLRFALLLGLGYGLFLVWAAAHHVIWRDEARAFEIATVPDSLRGLFAALRDEGHPALWYLLLRAAHGLVRAPAVLKVVSLLAALAGVLVFALYAPYSRGEVLLWALGFLSLHEYSILCRAYCLLPPLLFALCALYPARRRRPWAFGALLVLLANADAYGCVLAAAFLASECLVQAAEPEARRAPRPFLILGGLALAGIAAAVAVCLPDGSSLFAPRPLGGGPLFLAEQAWAVLISQGNVAARLFALPWGLPVSLVVLLWYLFLGRRLHLSLFLFTALMGCGLMDRLVYPAGLHHQGVVLLALVAAHWLATAADAAGAPAAYSNPRLARGLSRLARAAFVLILILQVRQGLISVRGDATIPASSSRRLAGYVLAHPGLRRAVLMAEPDYMAESLPYYLDNPVFIPREGRFGRWTSFTTRGAKSFTLGRLLEAAREVRARTGAPVLIVLAFDLRRPGVHHFFNGRTFAFDQGQVGEWRRGTTALATFDGAYTDENYTLYRLNP